MDWIEQVQPVFQEVSLETGIKFGHDTHYDARSFEYSTTKGNEIHRLDFQPMENGVIKVTRLVDRYPAFPNLLRQMHNWIPYFPSLAVVQYYELGTLTPPFESSSLKERVQKLVEDAL